MMSAGPCSEKRACEAETNGSLMQMSEDGRAAHDDGAEHVYMDATDAARTLVHIDCPDSGVAALAAYESHAGFHDGEQEDIEQGDQDDAACKKDDIDVHKRLSPKFKGA